MVTDKDIIPDEFRELYETFCNTLKIRLERGDVMSQFNIDEIEKRTLSGLKDFQRATVERVDYLFRHNQNRVLVADEVGMGKTLIARGAIVKTARLRIEVICLR